MIQTPVTFIVQGPNPQTGIVYTNAQGQATFTYRGTAAGIDVIQATVSSNGNVLVADAVKNWTQVTPTIEVQSPANGAQFTAGATVLVSGMAAPGDPGIPIVAVTVNGQPVDTLDAGGDFFTQVTLPQGATTLTFVATDALGNAASTSVTLNAVTPAVATANESNLVLAANIAPTYDRTSFDEQSKTLYADLTLQNSGQYPLDAPLYLTVENISDPTVQLRDYDGVLANGTPYYVLTPAASADQLARRRVPIWPLWRFSTPTRRSSLTPSSCWVARIRDRSSNRFRRSRPPSETATPIKPSRPTSPATRSATAWSQAPRE